jgi:Ferritin-like domain
MRPSEPQADGGRWTRAGLLRAALGGGAVVAGGAAIGARPGRGTSFAAPSTDTDAEILGLFLLLERLQEDFYRGAVDAGRLDGDLRAFAETVLGQEQEHAAFLVKRLGKRSGDRPRSDFGDALRSRESFRSAAIDLEEAAVAAYVGQGANLTAGVIAPVAALVSVEARQAAWIRDLAGKNAAPNVADPARKPAQVLSDLRDKGWLR